MWLFVHSHKNPIKDRWPKPSYGRQKGKAKERPKDEQLARTKGKPVNLSCGRKLFHPWPF
jgi:hypothetical protein